MIISDQPLKVSKSKRFFFVTATEIPHWSHTTTLKGQGSGDWQAKSRKTKRMEKAGPDFRPPLEELLDKISGTPEERERREVKVAGGKHHGRGGTENGDGTDASDPAPGC